MTPLLAALLLAAASTPAASAGSWVLKCDISAVPGGGASPAATRTFRLAPGVFQEWRASDQRFGPNLCASFSCRRTAGRLEGSISSASVILTIALEPAQRRATWRTMGASGMKRTSGLCAVEPDRSAGSGPKPAV